MLNRQSLNILQRWRDEQQPTPEEISQLFKQELASERAAAFDITLTNGELKIQQRARLFGYSCTQVIEICQELGFSSAEDILETLWILWTPLALQLADRRESLGRPLVQGILGGQGTGKTTLSQIVCLLLRYLGYRAIGISIDDFYKTYQERQKLRRQDPRLIWRGPPGTHDVSLGINILDRLLKAKPKEIIAIPRFNKSLHQGAGDRSEQAELVHDIDIILFEGWLVGVRPIDKTTFNRSLLPEVAEVITLKHLQFARDNRHRLKSYLPLWGKLDSLMVLSPKDYRWSIDWRTEAEHKMIAQGRQGMSDRDIREFVYYFWRSLHPELYIKPLIQDPALVDLVVEIDRDHRPYRIYQP